ncbi:dienelactone hydrolase family protein [Acidiferrobacter sp.]|uniref:dienelactone hydrolase family protein n=1 Tax=Acidiferrobacter sp. TaxID=1872107 RepID=UPI00260691DC|nr:dienelactone hydrolase family protein [Acidiferrobacter sp.]
MRFFERPPLQYATGPHPYYAFIWLHGLGADGHDFAEFPGTFSGITDKAMRFIFPHAPMRSVTLNGGAYMPAWFDLYGTRPEDPQDEAGIQDAARAMMDLITEQAGYGIPAERVILGGFSQGGALALYTALTSPQSLAAAVGLSTYLPLAYRLAEGRTRASAAPPLFLGHGRDDLMVPYPFAVKTQAALSAQGIEAELHTYPIGHSIDDAEISDLKAFLTRALTRHDLAGRL